MGAGAGGWAVVVVWQVLCGCAVGISRARHLGT